MKVLVLGAGVIGTTTAYALAGDGHQVTVIDRQEEAGRETSFANGGLVTPAMSDPWAAPGMPLKLLKWLGREDAPLLLRPRAIPGAAGWGLRFLGNCTDARWRANAATVHRLASYSADALATLTAETGIAYDLGTRGVLRLFRDPLSMEAASRSAALMAEFGVVHRVLDVAGCLALEPALGGTGATLTGGIHFPDDRSGDAFKFTSAIARLGRARGVGFRFRTTIQGIETHGRAIAGVVTDRGRLEADAYVLALGSESARVGRRIGLKLPIYPLKGYSVTMSVAGWNEAPTIPLIDDARKLGLTRLGDRIRAAGTVELAGHDRTLNGRRIAMLLEEVAALFPALRDRPDAQPWAGLRPVTPDGPPILGRSPYANLYLNCGHGHLGWTMACGSARIVADLVGGRAPEIDVRGMTFDRYQPIGA